MQLLSVLPALLLVAASAPERRFTIDSLASEVSAKVAFFGLASKVARFPEVSGSIALSADGSEQIDLTVRIDATALQAPDRITLARLKGAAFFDVARYPTIVFAGRNMTMTSDRTARVAGLLTARGVTKPATLAVEFDKPPQRANGRESLTLSGETAIDRRDFGMTAYPLIVGRRVTVRMRVKLVPA